MAHLPGNLNPPDGDWDMYLWGNSPYYMRFVLPGPNGTFGHAGTQFHLEPGGYINAFTVWNQSAFPSMDTLEMLKTIADWTYLSSGLLYWRPSSLIFRKTFLTTDRFFFGI